MTAGGWEVRKSSAGPPFPIADPSRAAVQLWSTQLDHAAILTLSSAPPQIVPAPAPSIIRLPVVAWLVSHIAVAYGNVGAGGTLIVENAAGTNSAPVLAPVNESNTDLGPYLTALFKFSNVLVMGPRYSVAGVAAPIPGIPSGTLLYDTALIPGQPLSLVLDSNGGDLNAGDPANTLDVHTVYVDLPASL